MATVGLDILGSLQLVTAPTGAVISNDGGDGMRAFLRVVGNQDDELITSLTTAATDYIEREIYGNRTIRQATFDLPVCDWWSGTLKVPRPPLSSITSITYRDTDDASQTVDTGDYIVRTPWQQPGEIELTWLVNNAPSLYPYREYPITVRFVAGYATASVPTSLLMAIKLLTRAWYDEVAVDERLTATIRNLCSAEGWGSYA